jgi:tetratricopeptide (TPR) repeat protein
MGKMIDHLRNANILFADATVLASGYQWDEAGPLFHRCAKIRRRFINWHLDTARAAYMESEQISVHTVPFVREEEKIGLLNEARSIFEKWLAAHPEDELCRIELALTVDSLADVERLAMFDSEERLARSEELAQLAQEIAAGGDGNLPPLHKLRRHYRRSRLTAAIKTIETTYGANSLPLARALQALGDTDRSPGADEEEAQRMHDCYARALPIFVQNLGADDEVVARLEKRLGFACHHLARSEEAHEHYRLAQCIMENKYGPCSVQVFHCLKDLQSLWAKGCDLHVEITAEIADRCPVKEEIKVAAKWYADHLRKDPVNDGGDDRSNAMMATLVTRNGGLPDEQVDRFQQILEGKIKAGLEMFPFSFGVDYHPCAILADALKEVGIKANIGTLPCKSGVKIEVGKVTAHGGYRAGAEVVWEKH